MRFTLVPPDIVQRVLAFDCPLVEITGGEPLLQRNVLPLMTELCNRGKTVLVETSGAHDISRTGSPSSEQEGVEDFNHQFPKSFEVLAGGIAHGLSASVIADQHTGTNDGDRCAGVRGAGQCVEPVTRATVSITSTWKL